MKKINLGLALILLALVGCSSANKKTETPVVTPAAPQQPAKQPVKQAQPLETVDEKYQDRTFLPKTDIINLDNNVQVKSTPSSKIKLDGVKNVAITKKQIRNGLAYNGDSTTPFTGTFASVVGDAKLYTEEYVDGKLNGHKTWYSELGVIGLKEAYKNGVRTGLTETYYRETGKVLGKIPYVNGRISGLVQWFDRDGKVMYEEEFKNGTGNWKGFWGTGKVKDEGRYVGGAQTGTWKYYTQDGRLEKTMEFNNGAIKSQRWEL